MIKIEIENHKIETAAKGTVEDIIKELGAAVFVISEKMMRSIPSSHINNLQSRINLELLSSVNAAAEKYK